MREPVLDVSVMAAVESIPYQPRIRNIILDGNIVSLVNEYQAGTFLFLTT